MFFFINFNQQKRYEIFPKVPVSRNPGEFLPLERLWAYLTIKQLLDERDAAEQPADKEKEDTPEKKALNIALKVSFYFSYKLPIKYRLLLKLFYEILNFGSQEKIMCTNWNKV